MADMLKFRKGTLAQINSANKVAGTIYIAKDEKAMYVDISADERIRIGDFVRVATINDIPFPASTTALYYVEADNALLGYDGKNWKQINGTEELEDSLAALTNRVATNESDISELKGKMTTAEGKITTLENTVGKAAEGENAATGLIKDVADLKKAVGMGDNGEVEGIGSTVAQLVTDLDILEAKVQGADGNGGMVATLADHTSRIGTAETDINNLETALGNYKTEVGQTYATKTELANEKSALQAEIDADVAAEAAIARAAEQANANAAAGALSAAQNAQNDATEALTKIGNASNGLVKDVADNKAAAAAAQKTADDYIAEHKNDYTNKQIDDNIKIVSDIVAGHTSTLDSLTGDDGLVAEAKAAADAAQKTVDDYIEERKNDYTNEQIDAKVKVAKDAADVADGKAVANAGKISTLESKVSDLETNSATKTELSEAETRLTNKIANDINAANAMDYKGGVASEDDLDKKSDVKSGDTYVATGAFEFSDGRIALPGDLIIATGDEVNGIIAAPTWEIVHTGYDASLEQELKTVDGKIQLTSKVGNANNGQVSFVAEAGSSAKVSVANNTVTIGMVWEDFE